MSKVKIRFHTAGSSYIGKLPMKFYSYTALKSMQYSWKVKL